MDVTSLPKLVRNTKRFNDVVATFAKYGLAPWLQSLRVEWVQKLLRTEEGQHVGDLPPEVRVRMTLTELGTTFIKLGQILSTRPDLVGPEMTEELAKLQSGTPADPPETVRETIESELGAPPESLFAEFDDQAFASASIGQVHAARQKDGRPVVVKVQHTGIEGKIRSDLEIMKYLAELAEKYDAELRQYRPVDTIEEFSRTLLAELDFTRERRNLERFVKNFQDRDDVCIPTPFAELSSQRVLTMARLEGTSVKDNERLAEAGHDLNDVAQRGASLFLDMIFRDGFYHADPHPGNLMVLPNGAIGLLDCGMVGRIDRKLREQMEDMLVAAVSQDAARLADIVVRLGSLPPGFDEDALRTDVEDFVAEYATQTLAEFDLSSALNQMTYVIRKHGIILPSRISLLIKVLVMLEGTSRNLSPAFSLADLLRPYQANIIKRRASPQRFLQRIQRAYRDWDRLLEILPGDLAEILRQIKRGRFDVHLEHRRLETTVNRLVMGLLAAAMFVGSAQLWSREVPPVVFGWSVPGALGCAVAIGLGYRLLRAIRRTGNLDNRP